MNEKEKGNVLQSVIEMNNITKMKNTEYKIKGKIAYIMKENNTQHKNVIEQDI